RFDRRRPLALQCARLVEERRRGGPAAASRRRSRGALLLRPGHGRESDVGRSCQRDGLLSVGLAVVPKPVTLTPGAGAFVVRASTTVASGPSTPETRRIAALLAAMLG